MGRKGQCACFTVSQAVLLLGIGLVVAGLIVALKVVPDETHKTIKKQKVLEKPYNDFTKDWVMSDYKATMQYWVYDYKNTIGIVNRGQLPDMDQKGPYGYKEIMLMNITSPDDYDDGNKMTYAQHTQYVYDPTRSCAGCDPMKDKVLVPDISFLFMMQTVSDFESFNAFLNYTLPDMLGGIYDSLVVPLLGDAVSVFDTNPFVEVTVDQLLFSGYESPFVSKFLHRVLEILNMALELMNLGSIDTTLPPALVSFVGSRDSYGPLYTILTGKTDYSKTGNIVSFEIFDPTSNTTLKSRGSLLPETWWNGDCPNAEHAFKIDGNTGDFYPSLLKKSDVVPIYVSDICRTIYMVYEKEIKQNGIPGYRYILSNSAFDYTRPENCGFCKQLQYGYYNKEENSSCLPSGLLDISRCQGGLPIVISKPHFYGADAIVQSFVPRFQPSYDDEVIMDVEPQSGTILTAMKRLQINVLWNQFKNINSFKVMRPGAYPVYWLNESFIIDDKTAKDLKHDLITQVRTYKIICYSAVGLGGLLILLSLVTDALICFVVRKKNE